MYSKLRELKRRHDRLVGQADSLQQDQRRLLLRQGLLLAWCDVLTSVRLYIANHSAEGGGSATQHPLLDPLLQQDVSLMASFSTEDISRCQALLEELTQQDPHTLSPYTTPMGYFLTAMSKPLCEDVVTMTADGAAAMMQRTVRSVSFLIHRMKVAPPEQQQQLEQQLAQEWERYWACLLQVMLLGNGDAVIEASHHINMETMQREPEAAAAHQAAQAALLMPQLELTPQQVEVLAAGTSLLMELCSSIHAERHSIQAQMPPAGAAALGHPQDTPAAAAAAAGGMQAAAAAEGGEQAAAAAAAGDSFQDSQMQCCAAAQGKCGCLNPAAAGMTHEGAAAAAGLLPAAAANGHTHADPTQHWTAAVAGGSSAGAVSGQLATAAAAASAGSSSANSNSSSRVPLCLLDFPLLQQRLEQQEALNDRLSVLLRKEYFLRVVYVGWVCGRLTLTQMSRCGVLSYPYAMRLLFLGLEVLKQWEQQRPCHALKPCSGV